MTLAAQDYFPRVINQYVPSMEFAADVVGGKVITNLGAPTLADPDGILDGVTVGDGSTHSFTSATPWATTFDGSSTSLTTTAGMLDSRWGRCLNVLGDASTDQVVTITGRDYLGQVMVENMTLNGVTVQFGKKAFKFVDTIATSASSNGSTMDVGWSDRLGLPYKAEKILAYTEDDVSFPHDVAFTSHLVVPGTEYAAGTDIWGSPAPIAGQVTGYKSVLMTAAGGADNLNTPFIGTGAVDIVGLSITHTNPTSIGVTDSGTTTETDVPTARIDAGETWGTGNDGGGTGSASYIMTISPLTFLAGDETTVTATTNDTRGTILLTTASDSSINYEVTYMVDTTNLHGAVHFAG